MWQRIKDTRLFKIVSNRYLLTIGIFIVWLTFFDKNNMIDQAEHRMQLHKLRQKEKYYTQKIDEVNKQKAELLSNPENMEKFAREKYFMKKDNEDVYIVNTTPDTTDR